MIVDQNLCKQDHELILISVNIAMHGIRGGHFRTAHRCGTAFSVWNWLKKSGNTGCEAIKNNFRTDRKLFPFEWQYCIILVMICERLKNNNSDNKCIFALTRCFRQTKLPI